MLDDMNLLAHQVTHQKFGVGTIVAQTENSVK